MGVCQIQCCFQIETKMHQSQTPIGFEGLFAERTESPRTHIGFELFENDNGNSMSATYHPGSHPTDLQYLPPSHAHSMPNNSDKPSWKPLSFRQLLFTQDEIESVWCNTSWLIFVDQRQEIYLTLTQISPDRIHNIPTIQMAIDQHYLTSGQNHLLNAPECLLIRTTPRTITRFLPNAIISLEQLVLNDNRSRRLPKYQLMAMLCGSKETDDRIMFYKDGRSNKWYVCNSLSQINSGILTDEDHFRLKSILQQSENVNNINLGQLPPSLSALFLHPIVYVYRPVT